MLAAPMTHAAFCTAAAKTHGTCMRTVTLACTCRLSIRSVAVSLTAAAGAWLVVSPVQQQPKDRWAVHGTHYKNAGNTRTHTGVREKQV